MQMYNPVLAWANQQFGVKFVVSNSIFGAAQQPETHEAVRHFLQGKQLRPLCLYMSAVLPWILSHSIGHASLYIPPALIVAQVLTSQVLS